MDPSASRRARPRESLAPEILLLGWTIVGWLAALAWAAMGEAGRAARR